MKLLLPRRSLEQVLQGDETLSTEDVVETVNDAENEVLKAGMQDLENMRHIWRRTSLPGDSLRATPMDASSVGSLHGTMRFEKPS